MTVISRHGVSPDPAIVKTLTDMPQPKSKRELHSFLGIVSYLSRLSLMTVEVFLPIQRLSSVKAEWTWHRTYQEIYKS